MAAAKAEAARLEGNDAMRRRDYPAAFDCYTIALQSMPRDHLVLANRSQAALKLQHYSLAVRDAEAAISHGPAAWHKGHYRKAMAEFETKNFAEAVQSFVAAAERAPDDTIRADALAFVARAKEGADAQEARARYLPLVGAALGVALALLLLFADLQGGNLARGTGKGSLSAVDGSTASLAMGVFLSAGGAALGYAGGFGWGAWESSRRYEQLHKVTAVVDEPPPSAARGGGGGGGADTPISTPSAASSAGGTSAAAAAAGGGGKQKGRRRTTARDAALKAAAARQGTGS